MTAPIGNNENAERGLLPYPVIIRKKEGEKECVKRLKSMQIERCWISR